MPAMQETWVQSLGCEDSLEKEMATHSSILAWRIPWTEEPVGLQSTGVAKSRTQLSDFTSLQSRIKNKMYILQITEGSMKTKTCYQERKEIARKHNKQQAKNRMMEINLY